MGVVPAQNPGPDKNKSPKEEKKIAKKTTAVKKKERNKKSIKRPIEKLVKRRVARNNTIWFGHIDTYMATEVCWSYMISNSYLKRLYLY